MPELLTDEQAALIWTGQTTSLTGVEETKEATVEATETKTTDLETKKTHILDDELTNVFAGVDEDDEDEDEKTEESTEKTVAKPEEVKTETGSTEKKTPGRKATDLITLVSQLVDDEVLKPFEEGEIKTIEDARELIKLNLQAKEEDAEEKWWESKVNTYSPQIRAILHYAEQGGKDIAPLLGAIAQIEQTADLTTETAEGQEEIVREVLKLKNFDADEIEDQISTLKDLDKLKAKAEKFLPDLKNAKQQRVQALMQDEQKRNLEAQEATRVYLTTIQDTLGKDSISGVKLQREDKAKIYDALAAARYTSLNGERTNGFVKSLEDMQFGTKANYELFLSIVHHAVDPEGFLEKMKSTLKNDLNAETVKKLRSAKTTNANLEEMQQSRQVKKNTVSRSTFKNPFE